MPRKQIDPKYSIFAHDDRLEIVNASNVPIPEDEPLILFRGRDRLAVAMLEHYRELALEDNCSVFHLEGIDNRLAAFRRFRYEHPERMKQPGITRGL